MSRDYFGGYRLLDLLFHDTACSSQLFDDIRVMKRLVLIFEYDGTGDVLQDTGHHNLVTGLFVFGGTGQIFIKSDQRVADADMQYRIVDRKKLLASQLFKIGSAEAYPVFIPA